MTNDELQHWGIKGMHWGIRRYQNEDGSYTEEGKRRKSKGKNYSEDYWNAHDKKDPKYMSDRELQQRIVRLNNEKLYKQLTKSKGEKIAEATIGYGKKVAYAVTAGAFLGLATSYAKKHMPEIIDSGKAAVDEAIKKLWLI
jgi:hypothetical protein